MANIPEKITIMESKILELGKTQREKGYRGGVFTPGFVKSETDYTYRAINTILESLTEKGLVEKMVTSAIRKGSVVELDVYRITFDGMECLDKVKAGQVKLNGAEPPVRKSPGPVPKKYSKPWDDEPRPQKPWEKSGPDPGTVLAIRTLQEAVNVINIEMRALNQKLDRAISSMQAPLPAPAPAPVPIPAAKATAADSKVLRHRLLILESVSELAALNEFVVADDLKHAYTDRCAQNDLKPKGLSQFTQYLKRLEAEGIISLKRMGCKNLGIKGQGSRVVVKITAQGKALISG